MSTRRIPEFATFDEHLVVDADAQLAYWRAHLRTLHGCEDLRFEDAKPAIKLGIDACLRARGRDLEEVLDDLEPRYRRLRGASRLEWSGARPLIEAVWTRIWSRSGEAEPSPPRVPGFIATARAPAALSAA